MINLFLCGNIGDLHKVRQSQWQKDKLIFGSRYFAVSVQAWEGTSELNFRRPPTRILLGGGARRGVEFGSYIIKVLNERRLLSGHSSITYMQDVDPGER